MKPKKILVLGATGPTGILFCQKALTNKHSLTIYARTPSKLPPDITDDANTTVIAGELTNSAQLQSLLAGHDVVVSLLGPNSLFTTTTTSLFADTYTALFSAMRTHAVTRILALGTISIPDARDRFVLVNSATVAAVRLLAPAAWQSIVSVGRVFDERADGLDWTVYRVGGLANGDEGEGEGEVVATSVGGDGYSSTVNRADVARWLVMQVDADEPRFVREKPLLCSAGKGLIDWRPGNVFW